MSELFVDVLTKDIITALETHLITHTVVYKQAVKEYWKQVKEEFADQLELATDVLDNEILGGTAGVHVYLSPPVDRAKEYENQINMFIHSDQAGQKVHNLSQQHC